MARRVALRAHFFEKFCGIYEKPTAIRIKSEFAFIPFRNVSQVFCGGNRRKIAKKVKFSHADAAGNVSHTFFFLRLESHKQLTRLT